MIPRALPRRVASLSRSIPVCASDRLQTATPGLWPNLPVETQTQIAQLMAQLMRRMQLAEDAARREITHADDIECR
jgi:hypothetical protein